MDRDGAHGRPGSIRQLPTRSKARPRRCRRDAKLAEGTRGGAQAIGDCMTRSGRGFSAARPESFARVTFYWLTDHEPHARFRAARPTPEQRREVAPRRWHQCETKPTSIVFSAEGPNGGARSVALGRLFLCTKLARARSSSAIRMHDRGLCRSRGERSGVFKSRRMWAKTCRPVTSASARERGEPAGRAVGAFFISTV